jgi:hypothetical protein
MFFRRLLAIAFREWSIETCMYHISNYSIGNTDKVSRTMHDVASYVIKKKFYKKN